MVLIRLGVIMARCPPLSRTAIILWMCCKVCKPGMKRWLTWLFPWVMPIGATLYLRENWRVILIDMLVAWDRVKCRSPAPSLAIGEAAVVVIALSFHDSAYQLSWSPRQKQLTLSFDKREVWRSRATQPFVAVAGASSLVTDESGNFKFKDRIEWQCVAQRIDDIEAAIGSASAVIVRGGFDDGGVMCAGIDWRLKFDVVGSHLRFDLTLSGES